MFDLFRDSPLGQTIRWVTNNRVLRYSEELPGFVLPSPVVEAARKITDNEESEEKKTSGVLRDSSDTTAANSHDLEVQCQHQHNLEQIASRRSTLHSVWSRTGQEASGIEQSTSTPIHPVLTSDGIILVDWYSTTDSDNPYNWSLVKRCFVVFQILFYTFTVYLGSSILVPGLGSVMEEFGVSQTAAVLGIALYVVGYGIGPMIFAPLSEIPIIGRSPPYILTYIVYVILTVPTALTPTFGGFLVCRFLLGFFGSPCLATGPSTLLDMFPLVKIPYLLSLWAGAATFGPSLGPVIGGFTTQRFNWRWTEWEILWLAGPNLLLMLVSFPETSPANILLRRAGRLRKVLDNDKMKSQSEIDQQKLSFGQIAYEALLVPWQINIYDPAVAFSTFYTALVYAIYYSFFESLPLVFPLIYGFDLGQSGLPFLSILVCLGFTVIIYNYYFYITLEKPFAINGFGPPESRLTPGLYGSYIIPIGLFLFAWTSRESVHWIVPTIGLGISVTGVYIVLQSMFLYLPFTYPQHSASLFAANDLVRSLLAAAALLFSRPMFLALGVGGGVSLLGGLTVLCIGGIYYLFWYGHVLRAKSRYAAH